MEKELYNKFSNAQSKYTYYLLSIAAACIALTLKRTENLIIDCSITWLAFAVISWSLSFILGCYDRKYNMNNIWNNFQTMQIKNGTFELSGANPQLQQIAIEKFSEAIKSNNEKKVRVYRWQWRFLISGAVFYIVWHVIQMTNNLPTGDTAISTKRESTIISQSSKNNPKGEF